jgi:phospholipid/cholesterol/gamma-HCH transport system substrate-binding protein
MKRRDELLVGLLLLVSVVLVFGGAIWIARGGLARGYPMYARFPWGAGLKSGQAVLLAGVQVGFVDRVELLPDGTIAVALSIRDDYKIPEGSTATVQANGIFGDQLVAIKPVRASSTYMEKGDTIPVGVASPGMSELLARGDSISTDVAKISDRFRSKFVEDGGIDDMRKTVAELSRVVAQISSIAAEQSKQLTLTQAQLRHTIASVDSAKVDSTITNFRAASANLEQLSNEVRETNRRIQATVDSITYGHGTAGKLINDPTLHARMDTLMLRIDSLVTDFKKNPRKYINLKIF